MIILKLIRVKHWVKNLFIFLPVFFSSELLDYDKVIITAVCVFGFSLVASSVYIINDICDIDNDKNHYSKKNRPIAAGLISINSAFFFSLVLLFIGCLIIFFSSLNAFILTILYFFINILYSFKLKHIPIVDFITISSGFVIRILIGSSLIMVALSQWIIIMVFLLSLFLAVSKRRDDVVVYEKNKTLNRAVVQHYTVVFMDKLITIISSALIVSYLLFVTSDYAENQYNSDYLLITFLWVLLGVFRYNQITYVYNKSGSPVKILFKDKFIQIVLLLWIVSYSIIIYFI